MSLEEASEYELPFEYVKTNVLPERSSKPKQDYANRWWQYSRPRIDMWKALKGLSRYIATPRHAKHRIFVWLSHETLANDATVVFARDDDYFFGVLHSKVHELWALRMGTWLGAGNDPRYTPTTTFETFSFPFTPGQEPQAHPHVFAISEAARVLAEKRERWLKPEGADARELKKRTLTNLYNARPQWLINAHTALDRAVFTAYGWASDITDEQVLVNLLELNYRRTHL